MIANWTIKPNNVAGDISTLAGFHQIPISKKTYKINIQKKGDFCGRFRHFENIKEYYTDRRYFDFGISNEKIEQVLQGKILNNGLINYKEGFGASSVMYDLFSLDI